MSASRAIRVMTWCLEASDFTCHRKAHFVFWELGSERCSEGCEGQVEDDEDGGGWECVATTTEGLQVLVSSLLDSGLPEDADLAAQVSSHLSSLPSPHCAHHRVPANPASNLAAGNPSESPQAFSIAHIDHISRFKEYIWGRGACNVVQ